MMVQVTADLAKCLHNFSGLHSVKFDGCLVKCSGIRAIGNWPNSLKELSFSKCSGVADDSLSFLVQGHKELRKLDITCCRMIMYDSVDSITSSCRSLTSLRMESCSLVPKEAFVLFGQRCQLMEELDVTDTKIDDEGFSFVLLMPFEQILYWSNWLCYYCAGLKSISRCSKLSSLKLGICMNITDNGLKHIGSRCSKLKELDLYRFVTFNVCIILPCLNHKNVLRTLSILRTESMTIKFHHIFNLSSLYFRFQLTLYLWLSSVLLIVFWFFFPVGHWE